MRHCRGLCSWDHPCPHPCTPTPTTPTPLSPSVFDSSRGFLKQPFQFQIGAGDVIKGWDQGMLKMSKGEKATLTCTPDFAYGQRGAPPDIPPGATLLFDVELIGISGESFF